MPTKNCLVCGKEFGSNLTPKDFKKQKFCSLKCCAASRKLREVRYCLNCNQPFEVRIAAPQVHCSMACAAARRHITSADPSKQEVLYCDYCGKQFTEYKFRKARFCSRRCQARYNMPIRIAAIRNKPHAPKKLRGYGGNWTTQRQRAIERDGGKCQLCGRSERRGLKLDVHHIRPFKLFKGDHRAANQLSNLITLCRSCHAKVEKHGYPCPRPLL